MSDSGITQRHKLSFIRQHNARRAVRQARAEKAVSDGTSDAGHTSRGRLPRVTRLMALAVRFEYLLESGAVRDQAELAELGHVTRARVTQIMNLLHLAPDIQLQLLELPRVTTGKDPIVERHVRQVADEVCWRRQRARWRQVLLRLSTE